MQYLARLSLKNLLRKASKARGRFLCLKGKGTKARGRFFCLLNHTKGKGTVLLPFKPHRHENARLHDKFAPKIFISNSP